MLTLVALALALVLLPSPWSWLLVVGAAAVDVVETAALVWWSKRRRAAVGVETLVGRRATAATALAPGGQVRVDGELWEARSPVHVDPGAEVTIRGVEALTLEVEPTESRPERH